MCYREVKEIEEYRAVERAELRDAVHAQRTAIESLGFAMDRCLCHLLSILPITLMPI